MPKAATRDKSINSHPALCPSCCPSVTYLSNSEFEYLGFLKIKLINTSLHGRAPSLRSRHSPEWQGGTAGQLLLPFSRTSSHQQPVSSSIPSYCPPKAPPFCLFFFFFLKDFISKSSLHPTMWGSNPQTRGPQSPTPLTEPARRPSPSSSKSYLFMGT